eukprot:323906-Pleurochrysis_carterae.AAC.5
MLSDEMTCVQRRGRINLRERAGLLWCVRACSCTDISFNTYELVLILAQPTHLCRPQALHLHVAGLAFARGCLRIQAGRCRLQS